ncbi:GMC family oxidoreductase [Deinococcus detaillensis]|uniref:GMC family oxidoreductase n=1 Tax=Deinococcus detaillensis TaxID=2592048 RepID=A0A553V553_9DEIO|nr:GMC family oxidoreductase [Deinococcus detaillensis]TSA87572.1 GMC family oxidoreductase [Deinococcus detaillensis]
MTNNLELDVLVIGTGAGGAPLLARLAATGLRVLALEAGVRHRPAEMPTDEVAQAGLFWMDERLSAGKDPVGFGRNNSGRGVGGSTLHYTAYTPRAQPDDFELLKEFGQGVDWPLSYADLEPYYDEVEQFLGVSGPSEYPWGPPRQRPYPHPALPLNGAALLMEQAAQQSGIRTSAAANAALSRPQEQEGYGLRPACSNRGFCQAGCSTGAKASLDVTYLALAESKGASIWEGAQVTKLLMQGGRVSGAEFVRDGKTQTLHARQVVLAAGAIETPRLLLLSGVGNSSGQVGRNFMAHVGVQVWGLVDDDLRPYKGIPGGLISEDFHRIPGLVGGYLLQSLGVMPVTYATQYARGTGKWGAALSEHLSQYNHVAGINVLGECLPYAGNFLELSSELDGRGLPKPLIHFSFGENEHRMAEHAEAVMRDLWAKIGAREVWALPRAAHTIGTARMGHDPSTNVVDAFGRSHDTPGLWICDNSTFPSSLSVNPGLTQMALSLRTADALIAELRA